LFLMKNSSVTVFIICFVVIFGISFSNFLHDTFLIYFTTQHVSLSTIALILCVTVVSLWFLVINVFFGELHSIEIAHVRERLGIFFVNKIFFIFFFLVQVPLPEVLQNTFDNIFQSSVDRMVQNFIIWVFWFTVIAFLQNCILLARDRFEFLLIPGNEIGWLGLLNYCLLCCSMSLLYLCILNFKTFGINLFALLVYECILLFLEILYTTIKYTINLIDLRQNRQYIYSMEYYFDYAILWMTFFHFLHMFCLHQKIRLTIFVDIFLLIRIFRISHFILTSEWRHMELWRKLRML